MVDPKNFFDKNGKFMSGGSDIISHHMPTESNKFNGFWQPCLIYNREIKIKRKTEPIAFNFYCNTIFLSKEDAAAYLPFYIKKLVEDGDLPEEVIKEDNTINNKLLLPSVMKLEVGKIEKD